MYTHTHIYIGKSKGGPLVRSYRIRCVITENDSFDSYDDLDRHFHPNVLLNGTDFTRIKSYQYLIVS